MPSRWRSIIFDCDGVILNSNPVKTEAFRQAAMPYGEAAAQALVDYHVTWGGVSRFEKFRHFLRQIVPKVAPGTAGPDFEDLLAVYADAVREGLMTCEIAPGLDELRTATPEATWLVVSGGAQDELREVFAARGLMRFFDGGVFGSPEAKTEILEREIGSGNIRKPALFLGDSRYDHVAATAVGLDFLFVGEWSEFDGLPDYLEREGLRDIGTLRNLERELSAKSPSTHGAIPTATSGTTIFTPTVERRSRRHQRFAGPRTAQPSS